MDDDLELPRDLARTAPEEEAEDRQRWERWDRLADGDLSPEEEAELQALAATSAEDKIAFEAFRPLDADFRARMAKMFGEFVPEPPRVGPKPAEPSVWERWLRAVREGFSFLWRPFRFAGPVLAGAAVVFLVIRAFSPPEPPITVAVLLDFDVQRVQPGAAEMRGDEGAAKLTAGGTFNTSAQPVKTASVKIEPRCFVKPKPPPITIRTVDCAASDRAENGSMQIHGSLPKDLPAGPATLLIVLAASNNQPSADTIEKLPTDHPTGKVTWFASPQPIEILAP